MISRYLESLRQQQRYSTATVAIVAGWLAKLEQHCGDREPTALSPADLVAWRQSLTWTPGPSGRMLSENTVNQAVLAVRGFYRWAASVGLISIDPASLLKVRGVRAERRPKLSIPDRRKLLAFPDLDTSTGIRNRAVLAVLLETGISRQACSNLDLTDVGLDTAALMAKGRKAGGIRELSDGLCADLERYLKESRPLLLTGPQAAFFLNQKGARLSHGSVQGLVRHAMLGCGLKPTLFSS